MFYEEKIPALYNLYTHIVSVRLVEAEHLDWRLFRHEDYNFVCKQMMQVN